MVRPPQPPPTPSSLAGAGKWTPGPRTLGRMPQGPPCANGGSPAQPLRAAPAARIMGQGPGSVARGCGAWGAGRSLRGLGKSSPTRSMSNMGDVGLSPREGGV